MNEAAINCTHQPTGACPDCIIRDREAALEHYKARAAEERDNYEGACKTIAAMHAAAIGEVAGPRRGVVEDVADLRSRLIITEGELEQYRMRLAGALTALDGHHVDQSDPAMMEYLRSCPTIAAAIRERKGREAAEAKLAEAERALEVFRDKDRTRFDDVLGMVFAKDEATKQAARAEALAKALAERDEAVAITLGAQAERDEQRARAEAAEAKLAEETESADRWHREAVALSEKAARLEIVEAKLAEAERRLLVAEKWRGRPDDD